MKKKKHRQAGRIMAGPLAVIMMWTLGCGSAPPPQVAPFDANLFSRLPPDGMSPASWRGLQDTAALCTEWSGRAFELERKARSQQATASQVATIAGVLAVAAGAVTGALSGAEDDTDRALDIARFGGIGASVFGVTAAVAGIYAATRNSPAQTAGSARQAIHRALVDGLIQTLMASPVESRDPRARELGSELALQCAREARSLDALTELPLGSNATVRMQNAAGALRQADLQESQQLTGRLEEILFATPSQ